VTKSYKGCRTKDFTFSCSLVHERVFESIFLKVKVSSKKFRYFSNNIHRPSNSDILRRCGEYKKKHYRDYKPNQSSMTSLKGQ